MGKTNTRNSGIECLRILTTLFVVMLHYNDGRAFEYVTEGSAHQMVLFFIEGIAICAVDLFVLISGYFLSGSQTRSILKPIELMVQVIVFKEAQYILRSLMMQSSISIKHIIALLLPNSYFVVLYTVVYFVSPYINVVLKQLGRKQWNQLVLMLLVLFSVWPTLVDLLEEVVGNEQFGLSTIAAWGSQQGFNVINFLLMYILGGYLRYHGMPEKYNKVRVLLPAWVATVLGIFAWALVTERLTRLELRSAWVYHNPLVILSAVLLFAMFVKMNLSNRIINRLSAASFTCFILHIKIIDIFAIQSAVQTSLITMLAHILFVAISCYILSFIAYEVYHLITNRIFKALSNLSVFKSKEIV